VTKPDLKIHLVDQLDRGLAYGESCFETFRVIDGEVLALDRHLERLAKGLETFAVRLTKDDLDAIGEASRSSVDECGEDVLVRVTVTGGSASWGLMRHADPEVYIQCMPYMSKSARIDLVGVEWPFPLMNKVSKFTGDYALTLRAIHQWDIGPENTPLICRDGVVLSSLTANVLILRDGQWYTPDDSGGGVLPGIVRSILIEKGIAQPTVCPVGWLKECEAMMLTNSSLFAVAVSSVDGRKLNFMHTATLPVGELLRMYPGVEL